MNIQDGYRFGKEDECILLKCLIKKHLAKCFLRRSAREMKKQKKSKPTEMKASSGVRIWDLVRGARGGQKGELPVLSPPSRRPGSGSEPNQVQEPNTDPGCAWPPPGTVFIKIETILKQRNNGSSRFLPTGAKRLETPLLILKIGSTWAVTLDGFYPNVRPRFL